MTDTPDVPDSARSPILGRFVFVLLVGLVVMVLLGIYGIWSFARREKDWRDHVNDTETFLVPTNPHASPR